MEPVVERFAGTTVPAVLRPFHTQVWAPVLLAVVEVSVPSAPA